MGKKSGPAAPDPVATAQAQGLANKEAVYESARVNQLNEVTPYGSLIYSGEIGSPNRTRTVSLTPEGQSVYDTQLGLAQALGDYATNRASQLPTDAFSLDQFGALPNYDENYRKSVEDALFQRLQPQIDRDRAALETKLANQGFSVGSEGYNQAADELNRQINDLRLGITSQGGDEAARAYQLALQGRQQGINEYQLERNAPINELAAALQGSPAIGQPTFNSAAQYQVAPADVAGLTMGAYNANANRAAQQSQTLGSLISAGGSLLPLAFLSDRRLKKEISFLGRRNGLNWYSYRYIWGGPKRIGVMAQEVLKVIPEAVHNMNGWLAVDYGRLM